jgi:hypothetical protein
MLAVGRSASAQKYVSRRPEAQPLQPGLAFASTPTIYGLVVFLLGGPLNHLYYFAGVSILAVLAWGERLHAEKRVKG